MLALNISDRIWVKETDKKISARSITVVNLYGQRVVEQTSQ